MPIPSSTRPTRTRYWVVVLAVTLSIITYIDRVCISQAAPEMMKDLRLSPIDMGLAFAAFAWSYALFEIPGGWLGDWLGPRKVLMRIVLWWSFFTAATGWVWNLASLWATRFLFGAGEAGVFPNLTKSFTAWLPQKERVVAQGIMWTSARWGGAFTPLLVVWAFQYMSWRRAFEVFGAVGIVWAVFFYRWYRDNPRDHRGVNAAELALIDEPEHGVAIHSQVPWRQFIRSRTVWMLWAQYFLACYPWFFFITWLPTYLQEYYGVSPERGAQLAILPLFFGGIGTLLCGFLVSHMERRFADVTRARRFVGYLGFFLAGAFLVLHTQVRNPFYAMLLMGLSSLANDLPTPVSWSVCMDIGGRYAGSLSGSMNMMGNLAGGIAPLAFGYILQMTQSYSVNFYVMGIVYLLAALCWRFIDPVTPLDPRELRNSAGYVISRAQT